MNKWKAWPRYGVIFVQYFFGAHSLLSGSNHFLHFVPEPSPTNPLTAPFMMAISNMGLFDVVKVIETVVGLCLVFNVWVPLAAIAEMPVTVIIWYVSVVLSHQPRPNYTGWRELLMNGILLAAYGRYLLPLLNPRLPLREIWTSDESHPAQAALPKEDTDAHRL